MKQSEEINRNLEHIEIEAWSDFYRAASPEVAEQCGLRTEIVGRLCAYATSKLDILAMNRVIGLGTFEPASEEQVVKIVEMYHKSGIPRFFVQVYPQSKPALISDWLQVHNFKYFNNWVKLYRPVEPVPEAQSDLTVKEITETEAMQFGKILVNSFE